MHDWYNYKILPLIPSYRSSKIPNNYDWNWIFYLVRLSPGFRSSLNLWQIWTDFRLKVRVSKICRGLPLNRRGLNFWNLNLLTLTLKHYIFVVQILRILQNKLISPQSFYWACVALSVLLCFVLYNVVCLLFIFIVFFNCLICLSTTYNFESHFSIFRLSFTYLSPMLTIQLIFPVYCVTDFDTYDRMWLFSCAHVRVGAYSWRLC